MTQSLKVSKFAGFAAIAAVINSIIFLVAKATDATMIVNQGRTQEIALPLVLASSLLGRLMDSSIDLVLVDPPYMTTQLGYDLEASRKFRLDLWWKEILRVSKDNAPILVFAGNRFVFDMVEIGKMQFRYEMIWHKTNKATGGLACDMRPLLSHEYVLYFSKKFGNSSNYMYKNTYNHGVIVDKSDYKDSKRSYSTQHATKDYKHKEYKKLNSKKYPRSVLHYPAQINNRLHPSQKPQALIDYLVNTYSNRGDLVLDTLSGSGQQSLG